MFKSIRPFQYLWKAFKGERTPSQIAFAVALGMVIGLIPKGNLTAWIFGFVLFSLRVNLGAGLLTAIVITSVSSFIDPLTHKIGLRLLSWEPLQHLLLQWHDAPLVPWLALNNTVVLGSTILGLTLFYPVKRLSEQCAQSMQAWWSRETSSDSTPRPDETVTQILRSIATSRAADAESQIQG